MTTNVTECTNGVLKGSRALPSTPLLNSWFLHHIRDNNENRTRGYPPKPNPNLMGKTRCDFVRVRVLPWFNFWVRVW
ncbi:hypothetical protein Lal_00010783 [Lupinus albus]|nr:hypothetical protein Lal_00010783 [Lupinus albus]